MEEEWIWNRSGYGTGMFMEEEWIWNRSEHGRGVNMEGDVLGWRRSPQRVAT